MKENIGNTKKQLIDMMQDDEKAGLYNEPNITDKCKTNSAYSEEEVKEIIKLSCEEGMLIQRTINDKVKIPYTRIKDFTIKMFKQFKKK